MESLHAGIEVESKPLSSVFAEFGDEVGGSEPIGVFLRSLGENQVENSSVVYERSAFESVLEVLVSVSPREVLVDDLETPVRILEDGENSGLVRLNDERCMSFLLVVGRPSLLAFIPIFYSKTYKQSTGNTKLLPTVLD